MRTKRAYTSFLITVCFFYCLSCRKSETPRTPVSYTKKMSGQHTWVGEMYSSNVGVHDTMFDASIYVLDDTTVVFDRKIRIEPISLYYCGSDVNSKCNIYSYYEITNFKNPVQGVSDTLKYYYESNKIAYYSRDTRGFGYIYISVFTK